MQNVSTKTEGQEHAGLIRLGGLLMIVSLAIHVILNMVLKTFLPEDPTVAELQAYLSSEAGTWLSCTASDMLSFHASFSLALVCS